jgi:hypothetical protein
MTDTAWKKELDGRHKQAAREAHLFREIEEQRLLVNVTNEGVMVSNGIKTIRGASLADVVEQFVQ